MSTLFRTTLLIALLAIVAIGGAAMPAVGGVMGPGSERYRSDDIVQVIEQPDLDGIPQGPIVISRSKPVHPHFSPTGGFQLLVAGTSDSYEDQTNDGVATSDGNVTYDQRPGTVACQVAVWDVARWYYPDPSVSTWWDFTCNTDVTFGLNSCIWRGRKPNPRYLQGCNRPRGLHVQAGFWASGQTTTRCASSTWAYFHNVWVTTEIHGTWGGPGPVRYISC